MRSKARLTITLSKDLLRRVDRLIDRQTVRNRSHAIEMLIRQSLMPKVNTAAILVGGRADTTALPALASINGHRLITLLADQLKEYGLERLVILAGQQESEIRAAFAGVEWSDLQIIFIGEKRPLGTAGALKAAERYLKDGPFLVFHGDILTDINLSDFVGFHENENTLATIAVKPRHAERSYGKVLLQGNRITSFVEKGQSSGISIVNTGVYLFQPQVLSLLDDDRPARLEIDVFPRLAEMNELSAFFFQGIWFDISTPENYRLALDRWKQRGGVSHAVKVS